MVVCGTLSDCTRRLVSDPSLLPPSARTQEVQGIATEIRCYSAAPNPPSQMSRLESTSPASTHTATEEAAVVIVENNSAGVLGFSLPAAALSEKLRQRGVGLLII